MSTRLRLTTERRALLKGYLTMIERAPITGRTIHEAVQPIQALRIHLSVDTDISECYEERVKKLIRKLYPERMIDYDKFK